MPTLCGRLGHPGQLASRPAMLCTPGVFASGLPFCVGPTKSAVMVFGPLRGRPDCSFVVLSPTLSWRSGVDFFCSRDRLFHQCSARCFGESALAATASSISPVLGALEKVSPLLFHLLCSTPTSSPALASVLNLLVMTPRLCTSSIWHSAAGVVIFLGGTARLPSLQSTGSLVLATLSASSSDVRSPSVVLYVPRTTLHLVLLSLPLSPGSVPTCKGTWSHWCASALRSLSRFRTRAMSHLFRFASSVHRWFSCEASSRLDHDLRHRLCAAWAHSCSISLVDSPAWALHRWLFNPMDEANTPQSIRAHIRFVGHVCGQLQPPSWCTSW